MLKQRLGKKGFTLVEIIVVLVILAILAALLIPSMVRWIDKAEEKTAVVAGRSLLLAAQTIASEKYGEKGTSLAVSDIVATDVIKLAGFDTDTKLTASSLTYTLSGAQIATLSFTYDSKNVSYANGAFTVVTP